MYQGFTDIRAEMRAGFAEMRAGFAAIAVTLDRIIEDGRRA